MCRERDRPMAVHRYLLVVVVIIWCFGWTVQADNILVLSPITTTSHSNIFRPLVEALARRGHSIVHWDGVKSPLASDKSLLPLPLPPQTLRLVYSPSLAEVNIDHGIRFDDRDSPFRLFFDMPAKTEMYCRTLYRDTIFNQLMNSSSAKFDLIIIDGVFNDCVLPLVDKFGAPLIYLNCFAPTPWQLDAIGSSMGFDHFPHPGSNYGDSMNVWQRMYNTLSGLLVVYFHRWFIMPVVDRIADQMLPPPSINHSIHQAGWSIRQIENRYLTLLMTNTHFSINYQSPTSPAIIHVGGFHCLPAQPLPQELESFVNGSADDGVILVSFGSVLRGATIPDHVRQIFLAVFSRLPQRILWKWENQSQPMPANIKLSSWLPQQDLLGHPKVRLFITHGGLLSIQEAVYHSVPLIVLPVFADQPINAKKAHQDGYAIRLDWDHLNEDILYDAIQQILHNPSYLNRMKQVSTLMRDQMTKPLDRAIYWIEYVIRHRGAPHLRTTSRNLGLYQRCLFDVVFVIFVSILLMALILFRLLRRFFFFSDHRREEVKSGKKLN